MNWWRSFSFQMSNVLARVLQQFSNSFLRFWMNSSFVLFRSFFSGKSGSSPFFSACSHLSWISRSSLYRDLKMMGSWSSLLVCTWIVYHTLPLSTIDSVNLKKYLGSCIKIISPHNVSLCLISHQPARCSSRLPIFIRLLTIMQVLRYTKNIFCDILVNARCTLGRLVREAGLELDARGSNYTKDIAHMEHFNRHRNILSLYEQHPQIASSAYVAPNATVVGTVFVGPSSYFGFGSVASGVHSAIRIGANTKVGDNTTLETNPMGADLAYPTSLNIGNNVNIEHSCNLMSCIVDDDVHIGHKSVVMEGSQLERGCVIAPNSYVPAGSRIPAYTVWEGTPAKFVRSLQEAEKSVGEHTKEQIRLMEE